ncbi:penicillin-binding protein [Chryseobacterium pennae]|uniref:Penicillin-binding protein n=1 Tax=Chryseobacterium pennae TaxID=2258962 RepID=A0A3D9C5V6_9FLAO|nr:penicillin-binding protein [Chryseobacterium pennae]
MRQKIMTIQRAHINAELFESPSNKGLLGYDWMIWNEAKCADFGNYLL